MRRSSAARDRPSASVRPWRTSAWNQLSMPRVRNITENVNTSSSGAIASPPNIRSVRPRSREPGTWRRQSRMKSARRPPIRTSSAMTPVTLISRIEEVELAEALRPFGGDREHDERRDPDDDAGADDERQPAPDHGRTFQAYHSVAARPASPEQQHPHRSRQLADLDRRAHAHVEAPALGERRGVGDHDPADAAERLEGFLRRRMAHVRAALDVGDDVAFGNRVVSELPGRASSRRLPRRAAGGARRSPRSRAAARAARLARRPGGRLRRAQRSSRTSSSHSPFTSST